MGLIAEAKLNVLPSPTQRARQRALRQLRRRLRDARVLVGFGPASIETVDSRILSLARGDIIWDDVRISSRTTRAARRWGSTS